MNGRKWFEGEEVVDLGGRIRELNWFLEGILAPWRNLGLGV